jgi:hypothetical protein
MATSNTPVLLRILKLKWTFLTLPLEVRLQIYEYLKGGPKLGAKILCS